MGLWGGDGDCSFIYATYGGHPISFDRVFLSSDSVSCPPTQFQFTPSLPSVVIRPSKAMNAFLLKTFNQRFHFKPSRSTSPSPPPSCSPSPDFPSALHVKRRRSARTCPFDEGGGHRTRRFRMRGWPFRRLRWWYL